MAVMRLAEPRLSASIMMSCSMSHLFNGWVWDCKTKQSAPRTDSSKRMKISPFAKSRAVVGTKSVPNSLATASPNSGWARPENSIIFLRLSEILPVIAVVDLSLSGDWLMLLEGRKPITVEGFARKQAGESNVGDDHNSIESRLNVPIDRSI